MKKLNNNTHWIFNWCLSQCVFTSILLLTSIIYGIDHVFEHKRLSKYMGHKREPFYKTNVTKILKFVEYIILIQDLKKFISIWY